MSKILEKLEMPEKIDGTPYVNYVEKLLSKLEKQDIALEFAKEQRLVLKETNKRSRILLDGFIQHAKNPKIFDA